MKTTCIGVADAFSPTIGREYGAKGLPPPPLGAVEHSSLLRRRVNRRRAAFRQIGGGNATAPMITAAAVSIVARWSGAIAAAAGMLVHTGETQHEAWQIGALTTRLL